MKARKIYEMSKSWMFEKKSSTVYDEQIIDVINKVLAELYEQNNMRRMFKGKLPFIDGIQAHLISTLENEIDYEEEYQTQVIPKGIDSNLLLDDDLNKMSKYDVEYNNAQEKYRCYISKKKIDKLKEEANAL